MMYQVAAEGVLGIETNLQRFPWSFAINAPPASRGAFEACRIRIRILMEDVAPVETAGKYHYFRADHGMDAIHYRRPFIYPTELALSARGLLRGGPHLSANRIYHRFVRHRLMNLHSVGYVLTDLAGLLLLRSGFAPLHCSAFCTDDATVAVFAPPNTGKTLTTMRACMERDASYLSEDLAITDGETIHAVPWTSTFRYYGHVDDRPLSRMGQALTRAVPPLELAERAAPPTINQYLPPERILPRSKLTHVIVLERGPRGILKPGREEVLQKIVNLNAYEFNYRRAPLNVAYAFFNPDLDLEGASREEHRILRRMVENAEDALVVRAPDAMAYADLALEATRGKVLA